MANVSSPVTGGDHHPNHWVLKDPLNLFTLNIEQEQPRFLQFNLRILIGLIVLCTVLLGIVRPRSLDDLMFYPVFGAVLGSPFIAIGFLYLDIRLRSSRSGKDPGAFSGAFWHLLVGAVVLALAVIIYVMILPNAFRS